LANLETCQMSDTIKLAIIKAHRENLLAAKTFKDYKAAHIAYIEWIIEDLKCTEKRVEAADDFLCWTPEPSDDD
jgi:hypothetical protein